MSATDRTAADFEAAASALVHFRVRCEGLSHGEEVFLVPLAGGPSKVRLCLCACVCAMRPTIRTRLRTNLAGGSSVSCLDARLVARSQPLNLLCSSCPS
jgi:hypothetical protein